MSDLELTWTLTRGEGGLQLDYLLRNRLARRVYVLDELVQNTPEGRSYRPLPDRVIARNGSEPGLVSFVRGMTPESLSGRRERLPPTPLARLIEPNGEVTGRAVVPLPLAAWHNYATLAPLRDDVT